MSDEAASEIESPKDTSGASWMIVLLVMVLALAAGAGGTHFFMSQGSAVSETTVEVESTPKEPGEEFQERLVTLEPFVVNVAGESFPRFLKLKIELEASSTESKQELEARRPQVRDTTILLLASKRLPEVNEFEGRSILKDDLKMRINELLEHGEVRSVMFTEFVVQ